MLLKLLKTISVYLIGLPAEKLGQTKFNFTKKENNVHFYSGWENKQMQYNTKLQLFVTFKSLKII
jgi:hypothetical protein